MKRELLADIEPVYTKEGGGRLAHGHANWFAQCRRWRIDVHRHSTGMRGLVSVVCSQHCSFSVGKWFTPSIGVRASYQGFGMKLTDANITDHRYHAAHAELLWNVVGGVNTHDELGLHRWTVAPYIGGGIIHHEDNGNSPFTINYGVMAAYRLNHRLSVNMELAGLNTFQDFDGQGKSRRFGDQLYTLSAGLTVNIGKVGWKRAVDANPYRQQNEYLRDYINELLRQNSKGRKDSMLIAKSKSGYGSGDYSGLASLRARLAHKDWDGRGSAPHDSIAGQTVDGRKLIGMPFYFFFRINSAQVDG